MLQVKILMIKFRVWLVFMNLKQLIRMYLFLLVWLLLILCQQALKQVVSL